jgi:flagellar protein FlaG
METKAAAPMATPDLITAAPAVASVQKVAPVAAPSPVDDAADLRLIIERDDASGAYIYTTINRRTGEIVQRLPRETILRLGDDGDYAGGSVISTKA